MSGPFGEPGLPPAVVRDHVRKLIAALLETVPEDSRAAAIDYLEQELALMLETLPVKPAQAGEMILFGEAADAKMSELIRDVVENARREAAGDEASAE